MQIQNYGIAKGGGEEILNRAKLFAGVFLTDDKPGKAAYL
jgi:hypothetical protein